MARQGLMDDSGYHGFDECNCYENCTSEAYEKGYADAIEDIKELIKEHVNHDNIDVFVEALRKLKERNK